MPYNVSFSYGVRFVLYDNKITLQEQQYTKNGERNEKKHSVLDNTVLHVTRTGMSYTNFVQSSERTLF